MRLPAFVVCLLLPFVASAGSPDAPHGKIRISPETTRITSPLTADGYVDYVTYLNEKRSQGVNPEQNAAVWYYRAIGRQRDMSAKFCRGIESLIGARVFDTSSPPLVTMAEFSQKKMNAGELSSHQEFIDLWDMTTDRLWTAEEYPIVAEGLKANEQQLALVEKAGGMPQYYAPLVTDDILFMVNLAEVQYYREITRLLESRALLRAGEGDFDGASRDLVSMYQLGAHTGRGASTLIEGLVGVAIVSIAENTLETVITESGISEKQLAALQRKLEAITEIYDRVEIMDSGERICCLDAIQFASRSKPGTVLSLLDYPSVNLENWDTQRAAKGALYWALMNSGVDWNVSLEQTNLFFDEMAEALKIPSKAGRDAALERISNKLEEAERESSSYSLLAVSFLLSDSGDKRVSQLLISGLAPAVMQATEAWTRGEVRRRVSPLGCAIERYRRTNGKYPADLQALVPSFIKALPLDPYTDQPFHYRVNADRSQFAVYTFGPNQQDDNGATWGDIEGVQTDDMGMHSADWLAQKRQP